MLERVAAGERRALEEIHDRFGQVLFRYLLTLVHDRELAEEVLQDTFVAVWDGAHRFRGHSSVRTWLFSIARRRARDARRRRIVPTVDEEGLERLVAFEPGPEEIVIANDRREELWGCLELLSLSQREALVLVFLHGLSYEEAAEVLAVPLGTVRSRLSRAKQVLQARMKSARKAG